jgi:outer membrane protein TolC
VELDISKVCYNLLAGQENLTNLQEILGVAERQLEKNRVARANGLIGELPWLQSSLSVETARYNLSNAQGTYENSLRDFLTTLGFDQDALVSLAGSIEPAQIVVNPEVLILEYLPKRPDMISQRQTIERLELAQKQSNYSSKAPSLTLSAQWSGGPQRNSGLSGTFTDSLSGSLSLSIPIDPWIPGTRSNQSLKSSDAELEKARLDLVNTETSARSQIRSLSESLKNSWRSIEIARLRVEIAQRTYQISEIGFQNGTIEFLSLENTRNDLADAQYRLLQSELAYQNTILDLASALNIDLETLARSSE